jgi:cell fate regulator YaaT (PSP1 superfamily)
VKHEALKELRAIIKLPDWTEFCPEKIREEQLEAWIERWIVEATFSQSVTDVKYLDSEYKDLIKEKLAASAAEDLSENCMTYATQKKTISGTMVAFRRKGKK